MPAPAASTLRTKMCWYHANGGCKHGEACQFAHGFATLQVRPDLWKTSMCTKHREGVCPLPSEMCQFAHSTKELRATLDKYKTKPCRFYAATGKCRLGNRCRYAHGNQEMHAPAPASISLVDALSVLSDAPTTKPSRPVQRIESWASMSTVETHSHFSESPRDSAHSGLECACAPEEQVACGCDHQMLAPPPGLELERMW
mmetsp:Transcript_66524/g.177454  ORF Transcript_66524/g.177454 Transcript_66524/m.177454 type:complete len:200 (+) Transcript_66524:52-651(+)